jgi:TetR/AcrR family transcriptional regulator, tetracycline repressor protein
VSAVPKSQDLALEAEDVITAAAEIFSESGLDAVSMRSVAGRLGVSPVALYSRVGNKDDLLEALGDHLLHDLAPAPGEEEPWDDYALRWAGELRARLGHTRDSRLILRPGREAYVEASKPLVQVMLRDGFDPDAAVQACRLLTWATVGFGAVETGVEPPRRHRRRSTRAGADPAGVEPADVDALFAIHLRYLLQGIEEDGR